MLENMRRLHPRGVANGGICVDAKGAMLGPDYVLVRHTPRGFRPIDRDDASQLQKYLLDSVRDDDWLFRQCRRIADALDKGEVALAQIYGLRIPVGDLDARQLARISLAKAGFNPDEPRLPKGDSHGGEWTAGGSGTAAPPSISSPDTLLADLTGSGTDGDASLAPNAVSGGRQPASSSAEPPMKFEMVPLIEPASARPPAKEPSFTSDPSTFGSPDVGANIPIGSDPGGADESASLDAPGIDAINPDYTIENLLLLLGTGGLGGWSPGALRRALAALGIFPPAGFVTHHIVAKGALLANPARVMLERLGIGIDDPANGIFLLRAQHDRLHSIAYYIAINKALAAATTKSEAERILRSIARKLEEGTFP